ncbi:hypothetical protein AVEN_159736-1 [Araneus ventricosus]|uniref:Uncharacterized protein n=1 Tax=Araneus ventricosus TaxID=182803 RepID=A0A4Y2VNV0_ARAVE|nr:hypothetical protein AVEN_224351-1 [Araneus ventricosus]GBO25872.1 hypothetical protein AVEN_159736-1 [Araneus ventricosus]
MGRLLRSGLDHLYQRKRIDRVNIHRTCEDRSQTAMSCEELFNSNFASGDPTILPYEIIHTRNRGTVGHNVSLSRAWQVLDAYASRLITLTP